MLRNELWMSCKPDFNYQQTCRERCLYDYTNSGINETTISQKVIGDVGYPILLDVFSNMGFSALIFSSLIPLVHMGGLMLLAMLSTSFGTLTILATIMEMTKNKLKG